MTAWEALLALWLALPPALPYQAPLPSWGGRLVNLPTLHVGVRPASDSPDDVAITVQVSVKTPW